MDVLVVDDSVSVRKALERILIPRGMTVRSAASAEEALAELARGMPELVIADVVMPGMDGFELCQVIRRDVQYADVPVLLISGIVNDRVESQAREAGAGGIIRKPFTPDELLPLVEGARVRRAPSGDGADDGSAETAGTAPQAPEPEGVSGPRAAAAAQPFEEVLRPFLERPEIETTLLIDPRGDLVAAHGSERGENATVASYLKFFLSAAGVLSEHLGVTPLGTLMLEFEDRVLLVRRLEGGHSLALLLRDASGLSVTRYLVKRQQGALEETLRVHA